MYSKGVIFFLADEGMSRLSNASNGVITAFSNLLKRRFSVALTLLVSELYCFFFYRVAHKHNLLGSIQNKKDEEDSPLRQLLCLLAYYILAFIRATLFTNTVR